MPTNFRAVVILAPRTVEITVPTGKLVIKLPAQHREGPKGLLRRGKPMWIEE